MDRNGAQEEVDVLALHSLPAGGAVVLAGELVVRGGDVEVGEGP